MYTVNVEKQLTLPAVGRTVARIVREGGVTDLWRGNGAAVVRDVPYAAIIFSSFSLFEEAICGSLQRPPDVWTRGASGCLAGVVATCLTYPLDVLRARFGAEWSGRQYFSYRHGISTIVRTEGLGALFAGLRPTVLGVMPYSALSFAAFETFKALLLEREAQNELERTRAAAARGAAARAPGRPTWPDREAWRSLRPPSHDLPVVQKLVAGGVAGAIAQTATYPLHVVRRRLQVQPNAYASIRSALTAIYAVEGVAGGLYKGLSLTLVKGPIQSALGFTVNDQCKKYLRRTLPPDHS